MSKALGLFIVQLLVLMIGYPLWVRKSYKISFGRWLSMAVVASVSTLALLTIACYFGLCM